MLWKIFSIINSTLFLMALWGSFDGVKLEAFIGLIVSAIASIGLFLYAFKIKTSNKEIWRYFLFFYLSNFLSRVPSSLSNQFSIIENTKTDVAFIAALITIIVDKGYSFLIFIALWRYSEFQQWVESKMRTPR